MTLMQGLTLMQDMTSIQGLGSGFPKGSHSDNVERDDTLKSSRSHVVSLLGHVVAGLLRFLGLLGLAHLGHLTLAHAVAALRRGRGRAPGLVRRLSECRRREKGKGSRSNDQFT